MRQVLFYHPILEMTTHRFLGPIPGDSDSGGRGRVPESACVTSSQVMVQGWPFENQSSDHCRESVTHLHPEIP